MTDSFGARVVRAVDWHPKPVLVQRELERATKIIVDVVRTSVRISDLPPFIQRRML